MNRHFASVPALTFAIAACADPAGPLDAGSVDGDGACTMVPVLGHEGARGQFVPFADGDDAELVLGYQGFRFIQVVLQTQGIDPARLLVSFRIEVTGQAPYPQVSWIDVEPAQGGVPSSPVFLVYFNDIPYGEIVDRDCTLDVSVEHAQCPGRTRARVHLVDVDPCIHVPGGDEDAGACVDAEEDPP